MITNNKIIFFLIFFILQSIFFFLYQKQERTYFHEYQALVKNQNLTKNRVYNDALNKVYVEISKNIKFENKNIQALGNIDKKRMLKNDWANKWFVQNQRLYFSISNYNKNTNAELEKNLKNNFSKTLKTIKLRIEEKINNIHFLKTIIDAHELEELESVNNDIDKLIENSSFYSVREKKKLDLIYDDLFLSYQDKVKKMRKQKKDELLDKKKQIKSIVTIEKLLELFWGDIIDFHKMKKFDEGDFITKKKKITSVKELSNFSKIILEKEIIFLQLQIKLIEDMTIKQTDSAREFKPIQLYLFSAIFFQFFLYSCYEVSRKLIKILYP